MTSLMFGVSFSLAPVAADPGDDGCGQAYDWLATQSSGTGHAYLYGKESGWCVWYDIYEEPRDCADLTTYNFYTYVSNDGGAPVGAGSGGEATPANSGPSGGIITGPWPSGGIDEIYWYAGWSKVDTCLPTATSQSSFGVGWDCPGGNNGEDAGWPILVAIAVATVVTCTEIGYSKTWQNEGGHTYHDALYNGGTTGGSPIAVNPGPDVNAHIGGGQASGCDALNHLEAHYGPREIGEDYVASMDGEGATEIALTVSLSHSVLHEIEDSTGFNEPKYLVHGFEAEKTSMQSEDDFDASVTFSVDYEIDESVFAAMFETEEGWADAPCNRVLDEFNELQIWVANAAASNSVAASSDEDSTQVEVKLDEDGLNLLE